MRLVIVLLHLVHMLYCYDAILYTTYGNVGGFKYKTTNRTTSHIFLNIPYATPPIGSLRWMKPKLPTPWAETRNGTYFGYQCVPHVRDAIANETVYNKISEDCLTLNVMKPTSREPTGGYPIMVWIHGGGYQIGSQTLFGYAGLANVYNPADILVVSIQYRIGVMGFAASGAEDFKGNYGLWDQTMALDFIKRNAHKWGGNPNKITVLGQSAGAGSAALLTISKYSYDFMRAAIIVSGNAYASWARGANITANSMALAETLKCHREKDVKICMQNKTIDEIFDAMEAMGYLPTTVAELMFAPRVDGDFLYNTPEKLLRDAKPKNIIFGIGNKDMAYFSYLAYSTYIQPFFVDASNWQSFDRREFVKRIKTQVVSDFYKDNAKAALNELVTHYVDANYSKPKGYDWYLTQYSEMLNDIAMSVPAREEVLRRAEKSNVYLYRFDHVNDAVFPDNLTTDIMRGSPHTNEYEYMLENTFFRNNFSTDTGDEKLIKEIVQQSFISFIKEGVPVSQYVKDWKKAEPENLRFLAISTKPQMFEHFYSNATQFWHHMREYGYDSITALPTEKINGGYVPISPEPKMAGDSATR